jgi:AraC-like DNA-binding protein
MSLDRQGGHAVWRYRPAGGDLGRRHHTDHVIPLMSRLVKAYLGDEWRPVWIELDYPRDSDARILEGEFETELRFDCAAVGLAIAVEDLSRPHAGGTRGISGRSVTLSEVHADSKLRSPMDPGEAVESLVTMRLLDGAVDIEGTARMAGLSVRSLQRSLDRCGSTYTEIVESVRRRRATSLLAESNLPVTQIALSLGYSDPANFTRAFRRWSGTSPRAFRARAQPARAFTH